MAATGWLNRKIVFESLLDTFVKLTPWAQIKNPVMFVTFIGAVIVTCYTYSERDSSQLSFNVQITIWLWLTVLFSNFAGAIAEGRGKAQASSLKRTQSIATAKKNVGNQEAVVSATDLKPGDIVRCVTGDIIPADGEVIKGIATVDESAITGESAPVIRESGGDRSAVTGGTRVVSDEILIRVTSEVGHTFLDRMISLIEGSERRKTPNEIALSIVLSALTITFLSVVITLNWFISYSAKMAQQDVSDFVTIPVLVALLVCLIPTTIGALLHAIGIAGMDRLIQRNVIAKSGRSIEAAGDIDLLVVDKTGTITLGSRLAEEFLPAPGFSAQECAEIAQLASLADETPEGRSIVVLAKRLFDLRAKELSGMKNFRVVPFSALTKMSGIDFLDDKDNVVRSIRKGAVDAIRRYVESVGGTFPIELKYALERIARKGGTPLLVSDNNKIVGIVHLKDVLKGGVKEKFLHMRQMGIRTLMITGDNSLTAAAIAAEAGVDDFIAEATPEIKLARIREEQKKGYLVAMTGDGTNDAPALAQADVGVAMNTGTQTSREAGNMIDLDSNPTKLIDIVEIGKQLLITRGALTTFSIANDIAKYFAILPAILGNLYAAKGESSGPLMVLNLMQLHSPASAILSAVIFNAIIILGLIPLALKGVSYKPTTADELLRHNLLIYGLGGVITPFIGIKLIDLVIAQFIT